MVEFHGVFWASHQGAGMHLVILWQGELRGVEHKRADSPKMTPSIRSALEDLQLEFVAVVYPGTKRFKLAEEVEAVPLAAVVSEGVFAICGLVSSRC